jgi:hypothetical protein
MGGPVLPPRHRLPILVAFYDMYGLQWDCSFPRSPHGEYKCLITEENCINMEKYLCTFVLVFEFLDWLINFPEKLAVSILRIKWLRIDLVLVFVSVGNRDVENSYNLSCKFESMSRYVT